MFDVGFSINHSMITADWFEKFSESGIKYVELSCSDYSQADQINFALARKLSDEFNVGLWSHHLPFGPFSQNDISSLDAELRGKSVHNLGEYIKKAAAVGIDKYIIHPSAEPIPDEQRAVRLNAAKDSLSYLAEIASSCGGVIAVEDLPRTCLGRNSSDILELLSADNRLRVCFDTNHLLKEDVRQFIERVGNKIITTHVSDYDRINERHWLPGEGVNDWKEIVETLLKVGYGGVWLYELSLTCPKTIFRDRDLTCDDLVKNASEIFEFKNPTVFATHIL